MEIAVLVGAKVIIGYSALTIGNWETSNPLPKVLFMCARACASGFVGGSVHVRAGLRAVIWASGWVSVCVWVFGRYGAKPLPACPCICECQKYFPPLFISTTLFFRESQKIFISFNIFIYLGVLRSFPLLYGFYWGGTALSLLRSLRRVTSSSRP